MVRIRLIVGAGYLLCLAPCVFPASPALNCKDLASVKISRTTIVSAELVEAGTFEPPSGGPLPELKAFCRVAGIATPSRDSDIKFEVWLPAAEWNGRLWGVGNGNFGGYMPYRSLGAELAEGYAVVGSDTGHEAGPHDANWAIGHPDKVVDYGYRAVHEVTVRAKRIVAEFYGRNPAHSYFSGCSNGGRQGLMEAQRFPADYDGILAGAPDLDATHLNEGFAWIDFIVLGENEVNLPSSKLPAIQAAALAACDSLDGITPDQHIWMVDGGFDRIVELDQTGKILGSIGSPGHQPGQMAWGHFLAISADKKLFVADILNWRLQVFVPVKAPGKFSDYVPTERQFYGFKQSDGYIFRSPGWPTK
jgi:feruloyl esterase